MTNPINAYSHSSHHSELQNIQLRTPTPPQRECRKIKLTGPQKVDEAVQQPLAAVQANVAHTQQPTSEKKTPPPVAAKPSEDDIRKAKEQLEKTLGSSQPQTPSSPRSDHSDDSDRSGCLLGTGDPDCPCAMCEFDRWFE